MEIPVLGMEIPVLGIEIPVLGFESQNWSESERISQNLNLKFQI